jgi:O-antigen/teichoic acid export membrane protein
MQLSTKIAYNTIIQTASKIIATLLGLVAIALITRYLGQTGFGQYTTIITFLTFFATIADLGLTLVTVQLISQPQANQEKILGNLLALRLISAIILLGIAPAISLLLPYTAIIKWGILITCSAFLFNALNQILVGLFQKNLRLDKVAIAEVASRIFLVIGFGIVVKFNYGLPGILIATVLANALSFGLHYFFSLSFTRIRLQFDYNYWRAILKKSWPLALTIILNLIYLRTDTLLLSIIPRPSSIGIIAEVGLYGAAYKVIDVLITLPFMFAGIILPIMTASWAEKNYDGFKSITQRSFDLMVIIAAPIIIGTQLVADKVMVLIAGVEFAASGAILRLLIIASGAIFFGIIFSHAIIAIDQQKKIIKAYLFTAITSVIGYLIFIPLFSYYGAAWVTIYSEVAIALAAFYLVRKYAHFMPDWQVPGKAILAALTMGGVTWILADHFNWQLPTIIVVAVTIYFLTLILFKGLKKEDLMILFNK